MQPITVSPMQWKNVNDINNMDHQLNREDAECLAELREVLSKYDRLERFGITLIHKHFELSEDETLLETIDERNRVLTIKPVQKSSITSGVQTQWCLASQDPTQWCQTSCIWTDDKHSAQPHRTRED